MLSALVVVCLVVLGTVHTTNMAAHILRASHTHPSQTHKCNCCCCHCFLTTSCLPLPIPQHQQQPLQQARHRNPKTPELWLSAIRTEQRAGSTKAAEALLAKGLQVCV